MARTDNLTNFLTDVAAAIKEKKGSVVNVPAANFDTEILALPGQGVYQTKSVTIASNGTTTITPDQNYDAIEELSVTVAVPINRLQTKSYNFTENTVTTLRPDAGYEGFGEVGLTINVSSGEDLDSVITAQENKLEALETILEGKIGASGGGEPNIFVQLEEPSKKKGIWLQTDEEPENYICDNDVFVGGTWVQDGVLQNTPISGVNNSAVYVNGYIYIFGWNASTAAYKYNPTTDTYTQLANVPVKMAGTHAAAAVGTDIYLSRGKNYQDYYFVFYKYDTINDTYTQISSPANYDQFYNLASVGTDLYGFSINSPNIVYRYDTLTDTWTKITVDPSITLLSQEYPVTVGDTLYLIGGYGGTKIFSYNTSTNTWAQFEGAPANLYDSNASVIGNNIYVFGSGTGGYMQNAYKYNTTTDTWTQLTDIPYAFYGSAVVTAGTNIYLIGNNTGNSQRVQKFIAESKTYQQDNSVVIAQSLYGVSGYATELFSNDMFSNPPKYAFADAWYYTTQDGLDGTMPVYYGNGTAWVNIKNPPQNQGGAE